MTLRTCLALQMHARMERGTWAGMSVVCMSALYEGMCMFDASILCKRLSGTRHWPLVCAV